MDDIAVETGPTLWRVFMYGYMAAAGAIVAVGMAIALGYWLTGFIKI